jgi:hypothetical protein
MGDKRPPSELEQIRPDRWLPEYTMDLLDLLNVLGMLVDLEPEQKQVLELICDGSTIPVADLEAAGAFDLPDDHPRKPFRTLSSHAATAPLFE